MEITNQSSQPLPSISEPHAPSQSNGKLSEAKDAKGKGKATDWDSDDDDDDDDDAYVTSNDYGGTPQKQKYRYPNGDAANGKNKGKEVAMSGQFEDEDDDLYNE